MIDLCAFVDATRTLVNTGASARRTTRPSPVTVTAQATREPSATDVSMRMRVLFPLDKSDTTQEIIQ